MAAKDDRLKEYLISKDLVSPTQLRAAKWSHPCQKLVGSDISVEWLFKSGQSNRCVNYYY